MSDVKFDIRSPDDASISQNIGTPMLRAYMHGYFMSIRLYNKAKSLSEAFNYEEYKKKKIREKIESEREPRVKLKTLPKVNKDLALKLMDDTRKPKNKNGPSLLEDDRFSALFVNPDFQINTNTEEYRLLNPVISRLDKGKKKELEKEFLQSQFQPVVEEEELEGKASSDESSSSDDDMGWVKEVKAEHKKLKKEKEIEERRRLLESGPKLYELKPGAVFNPGTHRVREDPLADLSMDQRIMEGKTHTIKELNSGNRELSFTVQRKKKGEMDPESIKKHREERRANARRPPTKFRMPSRVPRFKKRN